MISSDEMNFAEFVLNFEDDILAAESKIAACNAIPQSLPQTKNQVQWSQHSQQACMWQVQAAVAPVYQPTFNQEPGPSCGPAFQTSPTNYQYPQNCPHMNISIQSQQISGNQPIIRPNQQFISNGPRNYHRAHITLVHNTSGPSKAIVKRKRKRTAFTTEQILALEKVFSKKPYVNRDDRQALVEQLQVSDRAVKVWFQNRRIKVKREEMEAASFSEDSPMGATSDSSDSFGLAYVEAQMSQKTDEFGYVTLDDRAIGELVNVIDGLVGDNVSFDGLSEKEVVEDVLKMEYEPVSPAAGSDCSDEDAAKWRPPEPEQSLRQLLDMQHFC